MEADWMHRLENALKRANGKVAIYPYGCIGKKLHTILYDKFMLEDILLFDKQYCLPKIKNPDEILQYKDYYFIIATQKTHVKNEVISYLLEQGIHNTHIIKIFDYTDVAIDDRINKKVDWQLVESVRKYRNSEIHCSDCKLIGAGEKIIVSMTSFPARINYILPTLESLITQSLKPDKIILWLAREEFPNGLKDVPVEIFDLQDSIFSIEWCTNIRSYKKLVPALKKYPKDIIVTADDDLIYERDWLQKLYSTHLKYPQDIICHRITKMIKTNGDSVWGAIVGGYDYYSGASFLNKLTGGSGALYPPNILAEDVIKDEIFMKITPTSDDIWFWLMGVLNGKKVRAADECIAKLNYNSETLNTPKLCESNDKGEKLFFVNLHNILALYPEIKRRLEEEYLNVSSEL